MLRLNEALSKRPLVPPRRPQCVSPNDSSVSYRDLNKQKWLRGRRGSLNLSTEADCKFRKTSRGHCHKLRSRSAMPPHTNQTGRLQFPLPLSRSLVLARAHDSLAKKIRRNSGLSMPAPGLPCVEAVVDGERSGALFSTVNGYLMCLIIDERGL